MDNPPPQCKAAINSQEQTIGFAHQLQNLLPEQPPVCMVQPTMGQSQILLLGVERAIRQTGTWDKSLPEVKGRDKFSSTPRPR